MPPRELAALQSRIDDVATGRVTTFPPEYLEFKSCHHDHVGPTPGVRSRTFRYCEVESMRIAFSLLLLAATLNTARAEATDAPVDVRETPGSVEYGVWGQPDRLPAPTLFVLAGTIDSTLAKPTYRQCGNELFEHGFLCVSIDIPCHGTQAREGEPSGLGGWSARAANQDDFVAECNTRLSEVLDHLIDTGAADPDRIAACGTSRGGFLAIHFAAHDDRVRCVAGFAPVTDLEALSEFHEIADDPFVHSLSVSKQAERLAGRPVWIVIGDHDDRVGTDRSIALARRIANASREKGKESRVDLHVLAEPRGHTTPPGSTRLAADWMLRLLSAETTASITPDETPDSTAPAESPQSVPTRPSRTLLLVDDHHVLYRSGTRRVFHPAVLNPSNPVIREDKPWEMAIGWTSVRRDPQSGRYQLWYQAYAGGRDARKTHKCVVCYAESDDGVQFTKPDLPIHDFHNERDPGDGQSSETNIVLLGDGGYGDRYANSVVFDAAEPDPSRRYKMLYTDFGPDSDGQEWPGFFAAFSPDGLHWTKSPHNPLVKTAYGGRGLQPPFSDETPYDERWDERKNFLRKTWPIPISMSDAADVFFDPVRDKWVVYGKCWLQGPAGGLAWKHGMARVESEDFLSWSRPEIVRTPDDLDPPQTEFHTSPVFHHNGCYFCLNQILSARAEASGAKADAMHIELMISRDGLHWERLFREEEFIAGSQQPFSNGGIFTNATPVFLDDEIRFYYGGYNSGAIGGGKRLTDPSQQSGVGFASIPLDRFAGIRPVPLSAESTLKRPLENIGQITLKPIDLTGASELSVNADAAEGSIRVEILNEDGYRLRGFTRDDAQPIKGDSLHHSVTWQQHRLADLPPGRYILRLHLDNAEVFALTVR